jgi:hypothetical protein
MQWMWCGVLVGVGHVGVCWGAQYVTGHVCLWVELGTLGWRCEADAVLIFTA